MCLELQDTQQFHCRGKLGAQLYHTWGIDETLMGNIRINDVCL